MATILKTENFIEITSITADVESKDILGSDDAHKYTKVRSLTFLAGLDNDKCVIKNGSAASATITVLATPDVELPAIRYFDNSGQFMKLFIDFSEGTFNAGHKLIVEIE